MKKIKSNSSINNFISILKLIIFFFILIFFLSCSKNKSHTKINGRIPNLPDGMMYLCKGNNLNKIDSIETKDGKFEIKYNLNNEEPFYFTMHHIDKNNIFRVFSFSTNAKYNNSGYNSSLFMSDSIININDSLTENKPLGFDLNNKTKFVNIAKVSSGYQTNALFHTDGDLFDNINKSTYNKVLSKIKEYPNSFHLLYQINDYRNSFSPIETQKLINLFKGEIVNSKTYKNLKNYNDQRFNKKELIIPVLLNEEGKQTEILDNKYKKHLVIFWASWCGPCRQEIPSLKKMYSKYKSNIEFVSISSDTKNSLWQNSLDKEQMPWKQLIVNENSNEYKPIEIIFQLSKSIPYIVLIDNNLKVSKSHVGLMNEIELENFIKD